jgi:hypothetical protein
MAADCRTCSEIFALSLMPAGDFQYAACFVLSLMPAGEFQYAIFCARAYKATTQHIESAVRQQYIHFTLSISCA